MFLHYALMLWKFIKSGQHSESDAFAKILECRKAYASCGVKFRVTMWEREAAMLSAVPVIVLAVSVLSSAVSSTLAVHLDLMSYF